MMGDDITDRAFFVTIRTRTIGSLGDLRKVRDLDVFRHTAREEAEGVFEVKGLLTETQIREIRSLGYEVEVISSADDIARQRLKDLHREGDV